MTALINPWALSVSILIAITTGIALRWFITRIVRYQVADQSLVIMGAGGIVGFFLWLADLLVIVSVQYQARFNLSIAYDARFILSDLVVALLYGVILVLILSYGFGRIQCFMAAVFTVLTLGYLELASLQAIKIPIYFQPGYGPGLIWLTLGVGMFLYLALRQFDVPRFEGFCRAIPWVVFVAVGVLGPVTQVVGVKDSKLLYATNVEHSFWLIGYTGVLLIIIATGFILGLMAILGVALDQIQVRRYKELKSANDKLLVITDDAKKASEAKSNFLAMMSHELRTPLTAIMGYVEIINLGVHGEIQEPVKKDLERVLNSSNHLLSLISGILDFTKIDSGGLRVRSNIVPLSTATKAAVDIISPLLESKNQHLVVETPLDAVKVRGDSERVRQILINILSNAVKFTPKGGQIKLRAWETNRQVMIEVEDNGVGISPSDLEIIFEPFVQLDTGMTRSAGGTGLGLTISRELARRMGGDLTCKSRKGDGTTFCLVLPAPLILD